MLQKDIMLQNENIKRRQHIKKLIRKWIVQERINIAFLLV